MSDINTGGPAFPRAGHEWDQGGWVPASAKDGMRLRDYFAAKAMQAFIANNEFRKEDGDSVFLNPEAVASEAYWMADAMLHERSKA
nr:hypothetical protein [Pseudomonas sp.]